MSSGSKICMSEWSQSFTLTKNVGRGFILCSTPPTQWTVWQPQYVKMSPRCVMSSEKASNNPGRGRTYCWIFMCYTKSKFLALSKITVYLEISLNCHCSSLKNQQKFLSYWWTGLNCRLFFERLFSTDKRRPMSSVRICSAVQELMSICPGQLLQGREGWEMPYFCRYNCCFMYLNQRFV